jgi:hypothetical protein
MKHIDYRIRIDYDNIGGLNVPKGQRVMYGSLMVWMEHVDIGSELVVMIKIQDIVVQIKE